MSPQVYISLSPYDSSCLGRFNTMNREPQQVQLEEKGFRFHVFRAREMSFWPEILCFSGIAWARRRVLASGWSRGGALGFKDYT